MTTDANTPLGPFAPTGDSTLLLKNCKAEVAQVTENGCRNANGCTGQDAGRQFVFECRCVFPTSRGR